MVTSIASLLFVLISAFIMNGIWLITGISMIATTLIVLVFYAMMYGLVDTTCLSIIFLTVLMLIYSTYIIERQSKMEFLNMSQIRRMNVELRHILESLHEGIVLIDD
jgi:hypothetical protein